MLNKNTQALAYHTFQLSQDMQFVYSSITTNKSMLHPCTMVHSMHCLYINLILSYCILHNTILCLRLTQSCYVLSTTTINKCIYGVVFQYIAKQLQGVCIHTQLHSILQLAIQYVIKVVFLDIGRSLAMSLQWQHGQCLQCKDL